MTTATVRRKNAFRAVQNNDMAALAKAVKNRVESNWRQDGVPTANTLLEYACELGHVEAAAWLIDHGADINAFCLDKNNMQVMTLGTAKKVVAFMGPLTTSIYFNQPASLALLMSRGVNLDLPWESYDDQRVSCREFLRHVPDLFAEAERILMDMSAKPTAMPSRPTCRL